MSWKLCLELEEEWSCMPPLIEKKKQHDKDSVWSMESVLALNMQK